MSILIAWCTGPTNGCIWIKQLTWTGSPGLCGDIQRTAMSHRTWPQDSPASASLWKSKHWMRTRQSIRTDDRTRWRRGSSSSQQRLERSSDTIKHWQWQNTECQMPGNYCACCSEVSLCILKFHPDRRMGPITMKNLSEGCGCLFCVGLGLCTNTKKKKREKVIRLEVQEFGKAPRILCTQWQRRSTKPKVWGWRYLRGTPAAKVTALSQITTADPQLFMTPSVRRLSKEPATICEPQSGGEEGRWERSEGYWRDQPRPEAEEHLWGTESAALCAPLCAALLHSHNPPLIFQNQRNQVLCLTEDTKFK